MASLLGDCCGLPVLVWAERVDREFLCRFGQAGVRGCIPASGDDEVLLAGLDMTQIINPGALSCGGYARIRLAEGRLTASLSVL